MINLDLKSVSFFKPVISGVRTKKEDAPMKIDKIYQNMHPAEIPWNIETPPKALVELVESGKVKPCKTIDLGCGTGNYAIYLANKGFNVLMLQELIFPQQL